MLYLITNRKIVKDNNFYNVIEMAVQGKIDAIILREKDLSFEQLFLMAEKIKQIIKNTDVKLIINSNYQVAQAVDSTGLHLGFVDFMENRHKWNKLLGVSVHTLEEAILAQKEGADYLLASHIYLTDCKKGLRPKGVEFITEIRKYVDIPVIALGGIKPENTLQVLEAGASGIAVMSTIMAADSPELVVQDYLQKIKQIEKGQY